jgi:hypothetical protein
MLPDGISADLVHPSLQRFLLDRHHQARTGVILRHGGCACDLAGRRGPEPGEDERSLRAKYRRIGASRTGMADALEIHRRRPSRPVVRPGHWPAALAQFVAEHARNGGPAVYYLDFTTEAERQPQWSAAPPSVVSAAQVREQPVSWLADETPTLVVP